MERILAGLLFIGTAAIAAAQEPVLLAPGSDSISLAGHVAVLRDDTGQWTLDDVRSPALADRFGRDARERLNFGFTQAPYWYRIALRNVAAGPTEWVLAIQYPVLDYVDVHLVRNDTTTTVLTGDLRPPAPGQLDVRPFAVPVPLAAGEDVTLYVRAQTAGQHLVPFSLWSSGAFTADTALVNARDGAYLGAFFVMALYNFVIFAWLRDRAYLWYSLYLAATIVFGLVVAGYARQYGNALFSDAPRWIGSSYTFLQALTHLLLLLFARAFLQTRQHAPRLDGPLVGVTLIAAALVCLAPVLPYGVMNRLNTYCAAATMVGLFALSAWLSLRGVRAARFFLVAWCLMVGVLVWATLAALGIAPSTSWTTQGFAIALLLVVVLLSAALADRVLQERRDRAAAAESARRLKSFLPQKVADLVGAGDHAMLDPKRRDVTVCVIDLRGFTPFAERTAPEDVMTVLREFYDTMGRVVDGRGGTVEHFAGDSMLIFFNAPLEIPEPQRQAVQTALEMRAAFEALRARWTGRGHALGLGIGIADGDATIGAIGFSGRSQYAAIGAVTNLASRLCSLAQHGQILTTARVLHAVGGSVEAEAIGEQAIKGFSKPVPVVRLLGPARTPAGAPDLAAAAVP